MQNKIAQPIDSLEFVTLTQIKNKYNKLPSSKRLKMLNISYSVLKDREDLDLTVEDLIIFSMGYWLDEETGLYKKIPS